MRRTVEKILEVVLRIDRNTSPDDENDENEEENGEREEPDPEPDEPDEMTDALEFGDDEETHDDIANKNGIRIEVDEEIHGLEGTLSDRVEGLLRAYLVDENGTTIEAVLKDVATRPKFFALITLCASKW